MSKSREKRNWLEAIAERSGYDKVQVENVLAKGRIQASPVAAAPKRLLLRRLCFSGTKIGVADDGPFEFDWDNLTQGLWGIVSDKNLRGKTTVLEVVRWLLKGQPGSSIQDDVKSWIQKAMLCFRIDESDFEVRFEVDDDVLQGQLSRMTAGGDRRKVAAFTGEEEFASTMSDFFMRQFSIDAIPMFQRREDGGTTTLHDWQAVAGVMFIGTKYDTLIGELPFTTGLPPRLLQIFLGLPWTSTHTAINAYLKQCRREIEVEEAFKEKERESKAERVTELKLSLEEKSKELEKLTSSEELSKQLARATGNLSKNRDSEVLLISRISSAKNSVHQCEEAYLEDKRELQAHVDSTAANAVFRALDPTCCPRCDKEISAAKRASEAETNSCSVCGRKVKSDEDAAAIENELRLRLKASSRSRKESKKALQRLEEERQASVTASSAFEKSIRKLSKSIAESGEQVQLEKDIAVLRARLEELEDSKSTTSKQEATVEILDAAEKETKARFKDPQAYLLDEVSKRIVEFANRFGMSALTEARLQGNLNLSLTKGGKKTSYSKVTPGEQLRLKVATVLALISVGEENGAGRYPGVLLIDSPANNELVSKDLDKLIAGLEELANEFEHLQVFIASIASRAVLKHIDKQNLKHARKTEPVW